MYVPALQRAAIVYHILRTVSWMTELILIHWSVYAYCLWRTT